jgi:predicted nucleotidyltransferase
MENIYDIDELQTRLAPVFSANGVKSAVLFGSYAKGSATSQSDIDILVDSGLRGFRFCGLVGRIRDALHKEVDVFDVTHIKPGSGMELEIRESGVRIYG